MKLKPRPTMPHGRLARWSLALVHKKRVLAYLCGGHDDPEGAAACKRARKRGRRLMKRLR